MSALATLYGGADGALLALYPDDTKGPPPTPPPGTAVTLAFDPTTNAATLSALIAETPAYRLVAVGGTPTLMRNGVAVPIAAPGADVIAAQNEATLRSRVIAQLDALDALATAALAASALPAPAVVTALRTFSTATTTLTLAQLTTQVRTLAGLVADEIDRRQQTQSAIGTQMIPAIRRTIRLAAGKLDALD